MSANQNAPRSEREARGPDAALATKTIECPGGASHEAVLALARLLGRQTAREVLRAGEAAACAEMERGPTP